MAECSRSFRVTPRAKEDLINIARYTEQRWGKTQRDKYLREIDACFHALAQRPRLGKQRSEVNEGYYSFKQGSHVIFYLISDKYIDIIGVPHQSMDIAHYF